MTTFLLRILFSGLIAVIPSQDGQELNILLLDVGHSYHASDGTTLPHHKPMLVARAGSCSGDCPNDDSDVAQYLFSDKSVAAAIEALQQAVAGGGAWALDGSDLSVRKGNSNAAELPALVLRQGVRGTEIIPTTATQRGDFTWIADLEQICPTCEIDSSVLDSQPPAIVAARFKLRSGDVFTWRVARFDTDVTPAFFQRLDGTGNTSSYTQAVATWMAADIEVTGSSVEIVESKFDGGTGRSMNLTPSSSNGKVEVAVLNLPPFVPPSAQSTTMPEVGKHFEAYYELATDPPAQAARLVPRAGAPSGVSYPQVSWSSVHPASALYSELLNGLRLDVGRGPYDKVICPITRDDIP